ncbi:MAG: AcrR family transcriptional regulator [Myxococcota bacterium]|jgi:AcrR family transcriptional regulator
MGKGQQTREEILQVALNQASRLGLEGISIGQLAAAVGMSKSGLFAHFGSKKGLQMAILERASQTFINIVIRPAIREPRGEPRVRSLFDGWLTWTERAHLEGGCLLASSPWEFDDRPGPVRDLLEDTLTQLHQTLARASEIASEQGHFRADIDIEQFAFEMHAIMLGYHIQTRLFRRPDAPQRARVAFDRLLTASRV